jgi:hypothetical protein
VAYPTLRFSIVAELSGKQAIDNSAAGHGCSVPCALRTNGRGEKIRQFSALYSGYVFGVVT